MEVVKKEHGYPSTGPRPRHSHSDTGTDTVSVTESVSSVRAMCLYLDNHSISTISENELVYLPTGDTDRPNWLTHTKHSPHMVYAPAAACIVITSSVCHLHYIA